VGDDRKSAAAGDFFGGAHGEKNPDKEEVLFWKKEPKNFYA
jgi:hypothetical protein